MIFRSNVLGVLFLYAIIFSEKKLIISNKKHLRYNNSRTMLS